ncbi:hypothetical protein ASPBRDRAFT_38159 [Aspergillus brasiliensis CBS 101740]|uniref:Uncharacterized protein n=1 Tax=Aspergillus brasiliensis (strain CBS 101740 / IMI 381727 / IBT 21946) TaxID=767769 RepID=A0A1L9UVT0_ASPBC|nr:hypothetical protein ASPBRDRAFT_38159 [Aspergillus brasiliensis CBS 101740]
MAAYSSCIRLSVINNLHKAMTTIGYRLERNVLVSSADIIENTSVVLPCRSQSHTSWHPIRLYL